MLSLQERFVFASPLSKCPRCYLVILFTRNWQKIIFLEIIFELELGWCRDYHIGNHVFSYSSCMMFQHEKRLDLLAFMNHISSFYLFSLINTRCKVYLPGNWDNMWELCDKMSLLQYAAWYMVLIFQGYQMKRVEGDLSSGSWLGVSLECRNAMTRNRNDFICIQRYWCIKRW